MLGLLLKGELGLVPFCKLQPIDGAGIHMVVIMVYQLAVHEVACHDTDGGVLLVLFGFGRSNDGRQLTEANDAILTARKCTVKTIRRLDVGGNLAGALSTIEIVLIIALVGVNFVALLTRCLLSPLVSNDDINDDELVLLALERIDG